MTDTEDRLPNDPIVAVFVPRHADAFLPTLRSVFAHLPLSVVLGSPDPSVLEVFGEFRLRSLVAPSAADLVNELWAESKRQILLVSDPVIVPPGFLDRATDLIDSDLRVASVSFFSNSADFLSFPYGQPVQRPPEGQDERTLTRLLRELPPEPTPAPIALAMGAAVLLSATAIGAVGPLVNCPSGGAGGTLAEFSLRARRKGFISYLDPGTFYSRPSDLALEPIGSDFPPPDRVWVDDLHPFGAPLLQREWQRGDSAFSIAMRTGHSKVMGLRVLLDASNLGPTQMGTQTTILALIAALVRRSDVAEVGVILANELPEYAGAVLNHRKVRARRCPPDDFSLFGRMDIGHRPFQPDQNFLRDPWRATCDRFVVSILDVIGYQIGSYYDRPQTWLDYREALQDTVSTADGVFAISEDVRHQIELEQLPIDAGRLFAIPYGTEHLTGEEPGTVPEELVARSRGADEFILCLGTNYSHKNRDAAVRVHHSLKSRGWNLPLVLAGAFVPYGSSRVLEAFETSEGDDVIVLPDISETDRNWLLRHASLVLYPTSAEGFGLVPFEAARFGTPTVSVSFGSLRELGADRAPVGTHSWEPEELADAAESLMRDPQLARQQVEALIDAGADYTWDRTAEVMTAAYRTLIASPPRWPEGLALPVRERDS